MDTKGLITARQVHERWGTPLYAIYRLVEYGKLTAHELPSEPWHKRKRIGFDPAEVAAVLGEPR
jgi:hypothetical protein